MFKITAVVSLMLIGNLLAAGLSCDSCGSECAAACGTRHFRSCCFNYLRKKRGPETIKILPQSLHDINSERFQRLPLPIFGIDEVPEQWMNNIVTSDYKPYKFEDIADNRLRALYDV